MSAELVDPFLPLAQPTLTADEYEAIYAEVTDSPWEDPARYPECLQIALAALRDIACGVGNPYVPSADATQALRQMLRRAKFGGPLDEPQEPSWA